MNWVDFLTEALNSVVLAAIISGAFVILNEQWVKRNRRVRAKKNETGMKDSIKLMEGLQILRVKTKFDRIVVSKIHNGGDILSPTTAKFVSVLEDSFTNDFEETVKKDYQNIRIDDQYREVLGRAMGKDYYHIKVGRMTNIPSTGDSLNDKLRDSEGILYSRLTEEEINSVYFIYLGTCPDGLIVMSLQTFDKDHKMTPKIINALRTDLPKIRKNLGIIGHRNEL